MYLDGLNERQKEAVLSTKGPISVLAGAGSGKTRVLTSRIHHLIREGVAPERILAVTFTNKAAREMRERLARELGHGGYALSDPNPQRRARAAVPFIATFHGLGRELLESYGSAIGVPRHFAIFDRDDSERAVKAALKALDVDPKEVPPRAILARISKAKGEGMTPEEFRAKHGRESFRSRITAEAWDRYETELKREKSLDFDDLLSLPLRLLESNPEVRAAAQARWDHLHIDEYQDTNALQGRLAHLLAAKHRNIFVVGDIDQCIAAGTKVLMADGGQKKVEDVKNNDQVLSNYGSGDVRPARVLRVQKRQYRGGLIRIVTHSGRAVVSTPEHVHFAGYRLGITPQLHFTYLMRKEGVGWRLGVSQTYTNGQRAAMAGFRQRGNQEHADDVWVVGIHTSPQEARISEYQLSLRHGIPTLPFVARKGRSTGGYVHDQATLSRLFASFDTEGNALRLLSSLGLSREHPHHRAQSRNSNRRNVRVTLCGDQRGTRPMHRIALVGNDHEGKRLLISAGFSVRPAKPGSKSWRFETSSGSYAEIERSVRALAALFPNMAVIRAARLGGKKKKLRDGNALPMVPAASVMPGMAMFDETTGYDIVERIERVPARAMYVYDLTIEDTHNFFANGLNTHNCIYTWRGATIDNLLAFDETYQDAKTIILEHNYRSTKTIVDAANAVIEKNQNRKEKISVTDNEDGEKIRIHAEDTADREAGWVASECARMIGNGTAPESIAVLFRTNFQSRALEEAFLRRGVPYRLLGTRYYDRKEVKDVLAWVRLALDPEREADKIRAVQFPPRGIGKTTMGKLMAGMRDALRPAEIAKVEIFEELIRELSQDIEILTASAFVRAVIEKSGMEAAFSKGADDDLDRLENAKELATLAARYDDIAGKEGIAAFLADAALAGDQDEMDRTPKAGVSLMTVHAAKGLEFDAVFVTGMEEGLFPHEGMDDEDRDEEEERRLFYVAMTRARKILTLTLARVRKIYGTDYFSEPSQFLRDIDSALSNVSYGDEEPVID